MICSTDSPVFINEAPIKSFVTDIMKGRKEFSADLLLCPNSGDTLHHRAIINEATTELASNKAAMFHLVDELHPSVLQLNWQILTGIPPRSLSVPVAHSPDILIWTTWGMQLREILNSVSETERWKHIVYSRQSLVTIMKCIFEKYSTVCLKQKDGNTLYTAASPCSPP